MHTHSHTMRFPSTGSHCPPPPPVSVQVSTRKAYGTAIAKLGRYNERVVALDGDTNNLTYSEIFKNEHPNRFVECYIAQQNMVGPPKDNDIYTINVLFDLN